VKLATIVCAAPDGAALGRKPWMPPGAMGELAAMVSRVSDWGVKGWDEIVKGPVPTDWLRNSSLVMLTGLTPSYKRMAEIAAYCKKSRIPLIAGGRDVIGWSRDPGGLELLTSRFPSFCTTHVTLELMGQILGDCDAGNLQGHYRVSDGTPYQFVVPDRRILTPSDYYAPYSVRSSVGCDNNCSFCTVGGQGQFYKPLDILEAELKTFHYWFFLDVSDSFAGNFEFTRNILGVYKRSGMRWGTEATVKDLLGKNGQGDLIADMRRAGCVLLYVGIESITRSVHGKVSRERAEQVVQRCRREGIVIIGSLMLDVMGDETADEIQQAVSWATRWLDFAQFSLTALLPGCALRRRALRDGAIIEDDWRKFDGAHPTMKHVLSPELRGQLLTQAYRDFSTIPRVLGRALRAPRGILTKVAVLYGGLRYRRGIPQL